MGTKRTYVQVFVLLWKRWQVSLYVAGFLASLSAATVMTAAPWLVRNQLSGSKSAIGLTGGLGVGTYVLGCLIVGRYGRSLDPKRFVILSQIIACVLWTAIGFVPRLWMLFALLVIQGLAGSLFWGPMMGWVSTGHEGKRLNKSLGTFNLCWSVGAILGCFMGGYLYNVEYWLPFVICSCSTGAVFFFVVRVPAPKYRRQPGATQQADLPIQNPTLRTYRIMSRIALFTSTLGFGVAAAPLAILLGSMSLTAEVHGITGATYALARTFAFFLLVRTTRWHYKGGFLWACQIFAAAMIFAVGFCQAGWQVVVCVGAMGLSSAVMYKSSQFYWGSGGGQKSANLALHEAVAGIGVVTGSIGGGALAEWISIRRIYHVAAGCMILAVLVETIVRSAQIRRNRVTPTYC